MHAASAVQHWFGEIGDGIGQAAAAIEGAIKGSPAPLTAEVPSTEAARGPAWALSEGDRSDWMLQETEFEVANEYLSALQAHTAYFENPDVVQFICDYVVGTGGATAPAASASSSVASPTLQPSQ